MIKVDSLLLNDLSEQAKTSSRLRTNYNFHKEESDLLQRMLNVMEPGTYVCPHKHENPDKREAFWCIRGKIAVVEFENDGEISDFIILDPLTGNFGCEITLKKWHSIVALESNSVAYEVKDGPYNPITDKQFAPWAPMEGSPEADAFLKNIIEKITTPVL